MTSLRFQLALAALSLTIPSESFAAAQVPSVGWFQLPPQQAAPAVVSGTPVPLAVAPTGPAGLIADEGEDFEIVKLKYADVSEIVGLLTANQTIKSNDDFTPQEPNFGSGGGSGSYFGSGGLPPMPILAAPNGIIVSSDSVGQAVDGT